MKIVEEINQISRIINSVNEVVATISTSVQEQSAATEEIASSDEYSVEHDSDDSVHLLDGERSIRVSMPYHIWLDLCQETVHRHIMKHRREDD